MKHFFTLYILSLSFHQLHAQSLPGTLSKKETDSLVAGYCRVLQQTYFDKARSREIASLLKKN